MVQTMRTNPQSLPENQSALDLERDLDSENKKNNNNKKISSTLKW